jgi:hypothetical protein
MLLDRRAPGNVERASTLLTEAASTAGELGMAGPLADIAALRAVRQLDSHAG